VLGRKAKAIELVEKEKLFRLRKNTVTYRANIYHNNENIGGGNCYC